MTHMHDIRNSHSSDVVRADFFRYLLQLVADLDLMWFSFPIRTKYRTTFLTAFLTTLFFFIRHKTTSANNSPRRKGETFRPGHGYDIALKATFEDTPLALINAEGRLPVVSGPLICL